MYAVTISAEGDYYLCVPPDPGIEAAALGATESAAPGAGESALSEPTPTCVPCVEGRQRAAPYSSECPPTEAPLQTLHMDMWGPARVRGQGHERYFLLDVDDYSRYTTVFPLRRKGEVPEVLIDWIRAARRQLSESFGSDLPILRLHSDRGGEFSSDLLQAFCRAEGIRQTFMRPASPQQNGIAEHRIGIIHAVAPDFLRPFAVQYAAHQINLKPRVSIPETTPTLRWSGKFGDLELSSATCPPPVDPLPPQDPAPSGVSQVDVVEPVEVSVDSGATRGAEPAGVGFGGAEPECAEPGGAEPGGAEPGVTESGGVEPGGAEPARVESGGAGPGGPSGASSRREPLSPKQLREWFARRWSHGARAGGATSAGGPTAAGAAGGSGANGPGDARTGGTGTAGPGGAAKAGATGGAGSGSAAGGAEAGAAGAAGGAAWRGGALGAAGGAAGVVGAAGGARGAAGACAAAGVGAATGVAGAIPAV
ncbi:unnamed protein product [Closterium sp. NIES-65]|nr:unnamed protein product [Closterium sp. NIES-65]